MKKLIIRKKNPFSLKNIVYIPGLFICIFILYSFADVSGQGYILSHQNEECTIGVASGSATSDNRPLLWKTRDYASAINNEVYYNSSNTYSFISVITAGQESYSWMGINEKGFAIINSLTYDLTAESSGYGNGSLMKEALGTCSTISDFENLLDITNITGRKTRANFGVIDSTGAAKIIETSGSEYWIFDADDSSQSPDGYILRTNFSMTGGGNSGIERFNRTVKLVGDFYKGDSLNYKSIIRYQMRDFSDNNSNPITVPYPYSQYGFGVPAGYIYPNVSICRNSSVSASVIHGVLPYESAKLSTMWTILGQPASSIAVPYWPIGNTPQESNGFSTAPLCDWSLLIKELLFDSFYIIQNSNWLDLIDTYKLCDESGNGHWTRIFPAEDSIFSAVEAKLEIWRQQPINIGEMVNYESDIAKYALSVLQQAFYELDNPSLVDFDTQPNTFFSEFINFPNPFRSLTTFQFKLQQAEDVSINIYNFRGKMVRTLLDNNKLSAGINTISWDGTDSFNNPLPPGMYFTCFQTKQSILTHKCILVK